MRSSLCKLPCWAKVWAQLTFAASLSLPFVTLSYTRSARLLTIILHKFRVKHKNVVKIDILYVQMYVYMYACSHTYVLGHCPVRSPVHSFVINKIVLKLGGRATRFWVLGLALFAFALIYVPF